MYSILLGIFKVLSDGLTALSGVYGLLSDFRDENTKRITRSGKRALVGIALGFIISGAITVLEYEKSIAEERAHSLEVRRLTNPLGQIEMEISWVFSNDDPEVLAFRKALEDHASLGLIDGQVAGQGLPPELRDSVPGQIDATEDADFFIYKRGAGACPTGNPIPGKPDLFLRQNQPLSLENSSRTMIGTDQAKQLWIDRSFRLDVQNSTGEIASDEDFSGARLLIVLSSGGYWPQHFTLTTSHGRHFQPVSASVKAWTERTVVEYCYALKEVQF